MSLRKHGRTLTRSASIDLKSERLDVRRQIHANFVLENPLQKHERQRPDGQIDAEEEDKRQRFLGTSINIGRHHKTALPLQFNTPRNYGQQTNNFK